MSKSLYKVTACLLAVLMAVFSVPFTALAHDHDLTPHAEVPATCTMPGTEAYWECETCQVLFSDPEGKNTIEQPVEITAKGHAWGNWIKIADEVPATETTNGKTAIEARICNNDRSHTETRGGEVIPATDKSSQWETDPVSFEYSIKDCTISGVVNKVYTGKAIKPSVTVKNGKSTLKCGTDYTVTYKNNVNVGTATVTINGKGIYSGSKRLTFKITALDLSKCSVGTLANKVYTGKALCPVPSVKYGSTALAKGSAFTVAYAKNKNVGVATVTVTGKGNFKGSVKRSFKIYPKGTALKLSSPKKRQLKISWTKQLAQVDGYEIQYGRSSSFAKKSTKNATIRNPKTAAKTISKLKSKKKYYVRIRTYKKVGKTTYRSSWSTTSIKIK